MNAEDKNKEMDINEVAMAIEVSPDTIDRVRSGEVTHITMQRHTIFIVPLHLG